MAYDIYEINRRAIVDPEGFVEECDSIYLYKIEHAAEKIIKNMRHNPIVLLAGPSGSGKTTTAMKIEEELNRRGIKTYSVAMDNYFKTIGSDTPRTPEGELDLESPLCLDMELLNEHFAMLSNGERIFVPKYEFSRQMRIIEPSKSLRLGKDEIAIFEGIHALNDSITSAHPAAFKLYVSARANFTLDDATHFKGTWLRMVRRIVRDHLFRGASAAMTLGMWQNIRRGEKKYISPYKDSANLKFDTALPYEVSVLKCFVRGLIDTVPDDNAMYKEIHSVNAALDEFADIYEEHVSPDSLLREFIGGSVYSY